MIETVQTAAAFVVAIAILIAVHEYGHFTVARRLGIRVEKFSIGFGPALLSWRSRDGEVLYVIAAIPLGGYVKMLGENPDEQGDEAQRELSEAERARAFDRQPVWKRASIAVAGPGFNFLFAIVAYMVVGWLGQSVIPPVVGSVAPASVAERTGFAVGDRIVAVDGEAVHSWRQVEELFKERVGRRTDVEVRRDGERLSLRAELPRPSDDPLLVNVANESLGVGPAMRVLVDDVVDDMPAAAAGLERGDEILEVGGTSVSNVRAFIGMVRERPGESVTLTVRRDETVLNLDVVPTADESGHGRIGARMAADLLEDPVIYRRGPLEGAVYGFERTWEMTSLTLQVFGKMLTATISPENLGGPIAIAQLAGKTADLGLVAFVSFLALISVNLAVLNLLPVPVLDGGHLVYLGIEKVMRRPLPPRVMEQTQMIGMMFIILLMLFAFYNDLVRLFRG